MNLSHKKIALSLAFAASLAHISSAQITWSGLGSTDRFSNNSNWSTGASPASGDIATVTDSFVEIGTLSEARVGATVSFLGNSTLQRNSTSASQFSGTFNISDQTNVLMTEWRVTDSATLNWTSSGSLSTAPAGNASRPVFLLDKDDNNATALINMSNGLWNLTGNTATDSFIQEAGVFNMTGGTIVADNRFKIGTGGAGGVFNYSPGAVIRAETFGLFADAQFNMLPGSTVYLEAGLLGSFGTDGLDYWKDELATGSNVYIGGELQSLTEFETLADSNFLTGTVMLDGTWYNSITAVPEPANASAIFAVIFLAWTAGRRRVCG